MSMLSKSEVLSIIMDGGLLEDFLNWLTERGVDLNEPRKLNELEEKYFIEYARERKLIDEDFVELLKGEDNVEDVFEPAELRPRTRPKKY